MIGYKEIPSWRAGGYAIWLLSTELPKVTTPLTKELVARYPQTTPVNDGHLTAIGNLLKDTKDSEQLKSELRLITDVANEYKKRLQLNPLEVKVIQIDSNAEKPSQTLTLRVEQTESINDLRQEIATRLGVACLTTQPHFSLLYNRATNTPLSDEDIACEVIPLVRKRINLPLVVHLDGVVVVRTIGIPAEWQIISL